MIDIYINERTGLPEHGDTDAYKAANIMKKQKGELCYAEGVGLDYKTFMFSPQEFQDSVWLAHIRDVLVSHSVQNRIVEESVDRFSTDLKIGV